MAKDPFFTWFFPNQVSAHKAYHQELHARMAEQGKVLDLGCGAHTELARYRGSRREVWGVDFHSHPQLDPRWFRYLERDGKIPFSADTFDLVASSWVLEHVDLPASFLGEVARVLQSGGWFIGLTVSGLHYLTWLKRALDWMPHRFTQALVHRLYERPHHDTFPTRYLLNTPRQIRRACQDAGLEMVSLRRYANQGYFAFSKSLRRAAVVTDCALDHLCPGLGRIYLVVVLHKPARAFLRVSA
jgi:ubiquinone/menaquinone biosynthesis C-methylase UbiE